MPLGTLLRVNLYPDPDPDLPSGLGSPNVTFPLLRRQEKCGNLMDSPSHSGCRHGGGYAAALDTCLQSIEYFETLGALDP